MVNLAVLTFYLEFFVFLIRESEILTRQKNSNEIIFLPIDADVLCDFCFTCLTLANSANSSLIKLSSTIIIAMEQLRVLNNYNNNDNNSVDDFITSLCLIDLIGVSGSSRILNDSKNEARKRFSDSEEEKNNFSNLTQTEFLQPIINEAINGINMGIIKSRSFDGRGDDEEKNEILRTKNSFYLFSCAEFFSAIFFSAKFHGNNLFQ